MCVLLQAQQRIDTGNGEKGWGQNLVTKPGQKYLSVALQVALSCQPEWVREVLFRLGSDVADCGAPKLVPGTTEGHVEYLKLQEFCLPAAQPNLLLRPAP